MRITKRFQIKDKIFGLDDLKRIACVFSEQAKLANKSSHHFSIEYSLQFSDNTTIEGDTPEILEDSYCEIKRPVKVEFRFLNYSLNRKASFSLLHGDSDYSNEVVVSSEEHAWVNNIYTKVYDYINGTKDQYNWLKKHSLLIYNLTALGVGSFGMFLIDLSVFSVMSIVVKFWMPSSETIEMIKPIYDFLGNFTMPMYIFKWIYTWIAGFFWGGWTLANWVLSAWPNIELDFGADHLKLEKQQRQRLSILLSVIVIPMLLTILQDIFL